MSESQEAIGKRLRLMRLALGFATTREWARYVDVAESVWSGYETGARRIGVDSAIRVARKTGFTLDWIYMGERGTLQSRLLRALDQAEA